MITIKPAEIATLRETPLLARIFRTLELERKYKARTLSYRESLILTILRRVDQGYVNALVKRRLSAYEYRHLYLFRVQMILQGEVVMRNLPYAFIRTLGMFHIPVTLEHKISLSENRKHSKRRDKKIQVKV